MFPDPQTRAHMEMDKVGITAKSLCFKALEWRSVGLSWGKDCFNITIVQSWSDKIKTRTS